MDDTNLDNVPLGVWCHTVMIFAGGVLTTTITNLETGEQTVTIEPV